MTYLLDVSALLGLVHEEHAFHRRVAVWINSLDADDALATCSIAELGVVRILPQLPEANYTVAEARRLLAQVKSTSRLPIAFFTDHLGIDQLPLWVKQSKQTTDGHLVALAKAHGGILATFDTNIPGALVIPPV